MAPKMTSPSRTQKHASSRFRNQNGPVQAQNRPIYRRAREGPRTGPFWAILGLFMGHPKRHPRPPPMHPAESPFPRPQIPRFSGIAQGQGCKMGQFGVQNGDFGAHPKITKITRFGSSRKTQNGLFWTLFDPFWAHMAQIGLF